ncbi:MAG: PQQ-like beta-propeller repeat protein [Acidobacteriota bacterium]|nr:PQQ-like beta-propeller repeat protein [Acidobacteriota bacterium]
MGAGLVVAAGSGQEQASAEPEWPGWGGPRRNFTSDAVGLADSWPAGGPARLWSRPLGGGHSSILVDRGRLFTQYRPPEGSEPHAWREEEVVVALDAATGRTLWEHRYPAPLDGLDVPLGVGPHATPLIVGERLFATGTNKQLLALDKATGEVLWSHDLVRDFGAPPHYRIMPRKPGYSCSLLAYGNLIIATAGGPGQAVMAFHQDDGRVAWRSGDFAIAPASPILITVEGREQVLVFASDRVVALDPASGTQLSGAIRIRGGWTPTSAPPSGATTTCSSCRRRTTAAPACWRCPRRACGSGGSPWPCACTTARPCGSATSTTAAAATSGRRS